MLTVLSRSCLRAVIALPLLAAMCASAEIVEFAAAEDFERYFSIYSTAAGGEAAYAWSPAIGVGAEAGRVNVQPVFDGSTSVLFSTFTFDLNVAAAQASFLFQASAENGAGVPRIALLLHSQKEAQALVEFSLKTVWVQDGYGALPARLQAGADGAHAQTNLAQLAAGNWYELAARWTPAAQGQAIQLEATLWDHGVSAAATVGKVAEITALVTDPALFGAGGVVSPLYLGIVAQNGRGGAAALDRVRVDGAIRSTLIPEPSLAAWAFVLAGAVSVAYLQRRRRQCQAERSVSIDAAASAEQKVQ